jgi:histidinol-phosphate phosphatase family protein
MNRQKAIFIDRDGTLNEMVYDETHGLMDSPRRPEQVKLMPYAGQFLREVRAMGYLILVVTNQPGIAKGTMTFSELNAVNQTILNGLKKDGGEWDDLFFCPHHPGGKVSDYSIDCECRKPKPGMLLEGALEHGVDMSKSWMVGDGLNDIQAGKAAGCRTILVTSLKIEQIERFYNLSNGVPDAIAGNLTQALEEILRTTPWE